MRDADERAALCEDVAARLLRRAAGRPGRCCSSCSPTRCWPPLAGYDGSHRAQVALKRMTSVLTGRFVAGRGGGHPGRHGAGPLRRYAADLVVPRPSGRECALLKGIALRYVMRRPGARDRYAAGAGASWPSWCTRWPSGRPTALDPVFAPLWPAAPTTRPGCGW